MAMVMFATTCDNGKCLRRSEEYTAWPTCRVCGTHVCDKCERKHTRHEDDSDVDGVARMVITVICDDCLPVMDEFCTEPDEDPRTAAEVHAETELELSREWSEL